MNKAKEKNNTNNICCAIGNFIKNKKIKKKRKEKYNFSESSFLYLKQTMLFNAQIILQTYHNNNNNNNVLH